MPIYVARLNDGSCLLGEADTESEARDSFQSRWSSHAEKRTVRVLSVRQMPGKTFISRWWPEECPEDEDKFPGDLYGVLPTECDIYDNEYPLIIAAHEKGSGAISQFTKGTPVGPALDDWHFQLQEDLTKAVRAEMRRGKAYPSNVQ